VDGEPINQYQIADLHEAVATLSQDHKIYPLSLSENIGVGYPSHARDVEMVIASAKKGGADGLVRNLANGIDTTLDPEPTARGTGLVAPKHDILKKILENLELKGDLSGKLARCIINPLLMNRL
jgi:hypothetical protein